MDILTHTLTGLAVGTAVAPLGGKKIGTRFAVVAAGAIGGALPDIDANSLWSGFDKTVGAFLNLSHTGKNIYFSKYWYSHHGFFHSVAAALLFAGLLFTAIWCFRRNKAGAKNAGLIGLALFVGFNFHLLQDMLTPACVWGGVRFLWPTEQYFGGAGKIWWWNNYDIFLIVIGLLLINLPIVFLARRKMLLLKVIPLFFFVGGFGLALNQVNKRNYDFGYTGFSKQFNNFEQKSLEIQKKILGEKTYKLMRKVDEKIPFYF